MRVIEVSYDFTSNMEGDPFYIIGALGKKHPTTKKIIKDIEQHLPQGEGDKHYCTFIFDDNSKLIVFNLNQIYLEEKAE